MSTLRHIILDGDEKKKQTILVFVLLSQANQSLSSNDLLRLMNNKPRINERVAVGVQLLGRVVQFMRVFDWSA